MTAPHYETWDDRPTKSRAGIWFVVLVVLAAAGGAGWCFWHRSPTLDAVVASAGRLTLEPDDGDVKVVDRRAGREIWYRVTLENVPDGAVVPLKCEWIDPNSRVYFKNTYETRPVTHAAWQTHARCRFRPDAAVGVWRVRLQLHDRVLHELQFEVRDSNKDE